MPTQKCRAYRDSILELIALCLWGNTTAQQKFHDPFPCFLNIHDKSNNFQTGFLWIMTASPSRPTFKSAKVRLSCHQYSQDFSIMPSNSVQSHSLCWHCGVHCSSHRFQVSQSRAAGYVRCLALCWTCSTSLFQTVLKLPYSESKEGKGRKEGHTSSFLLLFTKAALLGLPCATSTCTCTLLALKYQHCQKTPHSKRLHEVPCSQGTPSPCPGVGEADLPADSCGTVWSTALEYWKCLDRQTLLGINCSLACLITPSQSNSLVYVLQLVTALHLLFKLSCPFYKYSIKAL